VYIAGVISIIGFYLIACFKIRPRLIKRESVTRHYLTIIFLFLIVSGCVTGFFALIQKKHFKGEPAVFTSGQNQETTKIPHVILIVLDTTRAESLSVYGPLRTSQNLEAFSRDALVFENCVATSPWTTPSHASLFTGLYSTEHGCHGVLDQKRDISGFPLLRPLSEEFVTLAEVFKENGYLTCAVASNRISISPEMKLDQGFQILDNLWNIGIVYLQYPFRPILHLFCNLTNIYPKYTLYYRTADEITRKGISLLEKLVSPPVFLFLNYLDAHSPYNPPRPFDGYFLDTPFSQLQKLKQYFLRFINSSDRKSWDSFQLSQYHGEIAYLDSELGRVFSQLKQMGIYDSALIIITSDHGELFGEHELYFHRGPIYEGVAKIPLVIKLPYSKRVGRVKKMITLADLYPTILSICGLPIPDYISGKAFGDDSSPVVSELYEYKTGVHRILYEGKYKYMKYDNKKDSELYDLYQDPMEQDNLTEKLPEVTLAMEKNLQDWEKAHEPRYTPSAEKEEIISKKMLKELKALGYIQ
jgi:arylsulfatase A-like enzyme